MRTFKPSGCLFPNVRTLNLTPNDIPNRNCTIHIAKTKALISFTVAAKLICVFVFTYADCWFSHAGSSSFQTEVIFHVIVKFLLYQFLIIFIIHHFSESTNTTHLLLHNSSFSLQSHVRFLFVPESPLIFVFDVENFSVSILLYLFLSFIILAGLLSGLVIALKKANYLCLHMSLQTCKMLFLFVCLLLLFFFFIVKYIFTCCWKTFYREWDRKHFVF